MSISVNIHNTTTIRALAEHSVDSDGEAHWIRLKVANGDDDFHAILFFANADLVDAYAAAINGVTESAAPVEAPIEEAVQ